jgi:hypothetical protein
MKKPVRGSQSVELMLAEIGQTIEKRLGFFPPCFVLILTDGKQGQTMFAGHDPRDMTRLLLEAVSQFSGRMRDGLDQGKGLI